MHVASPKDWTLISNENYTSSEEYSFDKLSAKVAFSPNLAAPAFQFEDGGEYLLWDFLETNRISSYLFTLEAGPYRRYDYEHKLRNITFSGYCRESLAVHFEKLKDFIFEVTIKSMEFYENYFGVPYSFSKYDSVFITE